VVAELRQQGLLTADAPQRRREAGRARAGGGPHPLDVVRAHRRQAGRLQRRQLPQPAQVLELRLAGGMCDTHV
jgi:hypothetical protein